MDMINIDSVFQPLILIYGLITLPLGIILLLWGYKVFKFYIAFTGFITGFVVVFIITGITDEPSITSAILVGLICSILFYLFYIIGIFVIGFSIGATIGMILGITSGDPGIIISLFIILGIIGGIIALSIKKAIIIIVTSLAGASFIVGAIQALFFNKLHILEMNQVLMTQSLTTYYINTLLSMILISLIGILYQYDIIKNNINALIPAKILDLAKEEQQKVHVNNKDHNDFSTQENHSFDPLMDKNAVKNKALPDDKLYLKESKDSHFNEINKQIDNITNKAFDVYDKLKLQLNALLTPSKNNYELYDTVYLPFLIKQLSGEHVGRVYQVIGKWNGEFYSCTLGSVSFEQPNHIQITEPIYNILPLHAECIYYKNKIFIRNLDNSHLAIGDIFVGSSEYERIKYGDIISLNSLRLKIEKLK